MAPARVSFSRNSRIVFSSGVGASQIIVQEPRPTQVRGPKRRELGLSCHSPSAEAMTASVRNGLKAYAIPKLPVGKPVFLEWQVPNEAAEPCPDRAPTCRLSTT